MEMARLNLRLEDLAAISLNAIDYLDSRKECWQRRGSLPLSISATKWKLRALPSVRIEYYSQVQRGQHPGNMQVDSIIDWTWTLCQKEGTEFNSSRRKIYAHGAEIIPCSYRPMCTDRRFLCGHQSQAGSTTLIIFF
jgi:hypothetical protein